MTTSDEMLDALANVHRRKLLLALLDHNAGGDAPVMSAEPKGDAASVERRVQIKHIHTHLPKLEDYGFISWDRRQNDVVKGPDFEEIRPFLELVADNEDELPDDWL